MEQDAKSVEETKNLGTRTVFWSIDDSHIRADSSNAFIVACCDARIYHVERPSDNSPSHPGFIQEKEAHHIKPIRNLRLVPLSTYQKD